jgi:hypothetical protein
MAKYDNVKKICRETKIGMLLARINAACEEIIRCKEALKKLLLK